MFTCSEKKSGNKNRALAYSVKNLRMIDAAMWRKYWTAIFGLVPIRVDCADLAHIGFVLANHGRQPMTGERIFPSEYASYVNAILMTCGMYDGSGDFAVKVGVPSQKRR